MRAEVEDTLRPIVKFKICLAGHVAETDFTLTDRSGQKLPVLIGRKFLADRILVDSNRMHIFFKTLRNREVTNAQHARLCSRGGSRGNWTWAVRL